MTRYFIDRKEELQSLKKTTRNNNSFVVVYGRRRIGKTTLLQEFLKNKKHFFYVFADAHKKDQLRDFKEQLANHLDDNTLKETDFNDWKGIFRYLQKTLDKKKQTFFWFDEISYAIKNDKTVPSALQEFIDHFLRQSQTHLFISGSLLSVILEQVLAEKSPLYGRRTQELFLEEIPFEYTKEFFRNNISFEEFFKIYLTIGGVPEYLTIAKNYGTHQLFVEEEFLRKEGYFYRELPFLLSSDFKEIRTYFSLLKAIAHRKTKPNKISNYAGIEQKSLHFYLDVLAQFGFIIRENPHDRPKEGMYLIKDPFIDAWFNFSDKNRTMIERTKATYQKSVVQEHLGKRFEQFIRNNLHKFIKEEFIFVSTWWYGAEEIDVFAQTNTGTTYLGECKYQEKVDAKVLAQELLKKRQEIKKLEQQKIKLVLFAKSFKRKISCIEDTPVLCFSLEDIKQLIKKRLKEFA